MFSSLLKFTSLLLSFIIIMSFCFIGGIVSAETAVPISSKEDFNNIRNNLSGNYYLTCDIEFSSSDFASGGAYYNLGKCFLPIGDAKTPFTGTFDGRGYTVSGIKVSVSGRVSTMSVTPINTGISTFSDDDWTGDYIIDPNPKPSVSPVAGIFGSNKGTIKNVNISGCTISARSSNGATLYVGSVAGHNNGNILNCSVKNTLNCDNKSYIGGIAGYQSGGSIKNCFVLDKIELEGVYGGIVGAVAGGEVTSCYSEAMFNGTSTPAFGVVGSNVLNNINSCYYISATDLDCECERISTAKAKDPKEYNGFNFEKEWYMSGTLRRPALKISEKQDVTTGDLNADKKVDLDDVVSLAQHVAHWDIDLHTEVANVDFNFTAEGEDIIDLQDIVYLAQYVAKWDNAVLY